MASDIVTKQNLGPEFEATGAVQTDRIRLKIGSGLAIQPDGTIVVVPPPDPPLTKNTINPGQDGNANNVTAALTNVRQDSGWSGAAFTGTPTSVDVTAMCEVTLNTGAFARVAPALVLQKRNGAGAFAEVAQSKTGYIRDANGHEETSNTIAWTDEAPGADPEYRLQFRQESTNGAVVPVTRGHLTCRAYT